MPDISTIPSELEVGLFSDNLLSTRLDTQERINDLFNNFNIPDIQYTPNEITPIIPKNWNSDDILQSKNLPSRLDFLTSTDPKMNFIAKSQMEQDSLRNKALTKGYGLDNLVRYQKGQEKFTEDHWWSEEGKTRYGFNPFKTLAENEDFYHKNVWENYSLLGKAWRGYGTFAGRVLSKLTTGLIGMVGDIGSMAWNGLQELTESMGGQKNNFWADVSDNWLARTMEEADQYTKEQILPTYKSLNYDDKGALSKLTDPVFWTNDLADGVGFLLQFAIPGTLFGKAAVAGNAGKLGRFGKVMSSGVGQLETSSRLAKGLGSSLEFLTGSRNVGGISAHVFNTTMESVAETKEGFNNTVQELIAKGYSKHDAEQIAAESAPFQFGTNMAILSFSNAFENKWFQRAVGNRVNPFRSSIDDAGLIKMKPGSMVGKFFTNNKWGNRIYFYGAEGAKAAIMEGYWEENAQLAAQRVARGQYNRRGEDTLSEGELEKSTNFFNQLLKQTIDSAKGKDREASDSILAGAVIGILGGTAFSKFSGTRNIPQIDADGNAIYDDEGRRITKKSFLPESTRRRKNREHAEVVARVKNARDAWLSINLMPIDIYDENGQINQEKAQQRVDELNEKLSKIASVTDRKITLDGLLSQTERENKQYLLFGDYVKAHILNGSGEALINRLKNWGKKTKDELEMYGVTEEIMENPLHWANIAEMLYKEYSKVDRINYVNPIDPETGKNESTESYFQKQRAVKSLVFDYIAQREASKATAAKYAELEAESNPFKDIDEFNSYNNLIARREVLKNTINSLTDQESKDHYQKELDKVNDQIEMRKNSLPEHEVGSTGMIFEKNSDTNAQEENIFETLNEYLGYQFAKEDFLRAVDAHTKLIEEYSDPVEGINKWNKNVAYWADKMSKTRLAKLTKLGYKEDEIEQLSEEEKDKIIATGIPKEEKEQKEKEEKEEEEKKEQSTRDRLLNYLQSINNIVTNDNLDEFVEKFLPILNENPESYPEELRELLTLYVKDKVNDVKKSEPETESKTEAQPATEENTVVEKPETAFEDVTVREAVVKEEKEEVPPVTKEELDPKETTRIPPSMLDEVRKAYNLHKQALENDTSFKEEAEKEGMKIHNNRIDDHIDKAKNNGDISIVTSNPRDIQKGKIKVEDNNISRFNFLDNVLSGKLDKNDFKMVLTLSKNNTIWGIVSDTKGVPLNFDEKGMPDSQGLPIFFYLDYDMFETGNISKRRSDVVKPPFSIAPLTATPIDLHRSFVDIDVIEMLKDRIRRKKVTASFSFLTQGLLYREGSENTYSIIPKAEATKSAKELWEKGHIRDKLGEIPRDDSVINGVYRRANRIHFQLLKDLNNKSAGTEVVEFHPSTLSEAVNEKGEKIWDLLKSQNGQNIFEAAIAGNLEATKENITTLNVLLRPDKFIVLNLGSNLLIINLKKFKKYLTTPNVTPEQLRTLTTIEDLKNADLNISPILYETEDEIELLSGILSSGYNNYSNFINLNVKTSAETIKKGNIEGYARLNKRIALTLDENIDDMIKATNQKKQENESPDLTEVKIEDEMTDTEKTSIIFSERPEEENFDDDFTKTDC